MSKARMMGYNKPFTPNSRADMVHRPRSFLRAKEKADEYAERQPRWAAIREEKEMERLKYGNT